MSLFFHFKNLTEDEIALFDARIREGFVYDLQIDCDEVNACAIVAEDKAREFMQFLDNNNIRTEDDLREIDARNGWYLK